MFFGTTQAKSQTAALERSQQALRERSELLDEVSGVGRWDAVLVNGDAKHPKSRWTGSPEFRRLAGCRAENAFDANFEISQPSEPFRDALWNTGILRSN